MAELAFEPDPDFRRLDIALRLEGEPDRVPAVEFLVEGVVKEAILGKHVGNSLTREDNYDVAADVEFWYRAGYDFIHLAPNYLGMWPEAAWKTARASYSAYVAEETERAWMEEGVGPMRTWEDFERYPWPDPNDVDLSDIERAAELLPEGMMLTTGTWGIFEQTRALTGFEGFCYLLADEPALAEAIVERVGTFMFELFKRAAKLPKVGALWYADDLAHRSGFLVSPEWYRRVLFRWHRKYGEYARSLDIPLIYHCDGRIWEVLDDIVEAGFSAIQPIEPGAMDIVQVKKRYGKNLCIIGNIDLGGSLGRGTPEEVRAEVRQRIRELAPGGGYCCGSSNSIAEYVPLENYIAMQEAIFEFGRYPISV